MSTLHTIKTSCYRDAALYEQYVFASSGDAIVLMEDAVLSLQSPISLASFLAKCAVSHVTVYAIADDLLRRGINNSYSDLNLISYADLVDLIAEHNKQLAW